jgi:thiamine pyrophosphokinase
MTRRVILFLDGEEPNSALVRQNLEGEGISLVVATDGAARYAMQHAIKLDAIVGDMDSLTQDATDFYSAQGTQIIAVVEQNSNDFEKALRYIASTGNDAKVCVFGIHGRRTDHVLANFSVLQRHANDFEEIVAYDETLVHQFLTTSRNTITLDLPRSTIISLTPMPTAEGVTTQGLLYPLENATMIFGDNEGLSNRVDSTSGATVSINRGALLVSHMF